MEKNYLAEHNSNLLWIDMEMTGLDSDKDRILELALIVTDKQLTILAESPSWVLACPENVLSNLDSWNTKTHGKSGLLDEVRKSRLNEHQVESEALKFAKQWIELGKSPMCGSTICQDRRFLSKWMPQLEELFHYRNFDVTSFKLAAIYFHPHLVANQKKSSRHRAIDDTRDSIEEMKQYKQTLLVQSNETDRES